MLVPFFPFVLFVFSGFQGITRLRLRKPSTTQAYSSQNTPCCGRKLYWVDFGFSIVYSGGQSCDEHRLGFINMLFGHRES